jgi:hypothetical protein
MVNYIVKSRKMAGDSKIFVVALARQGSSDAALGRGFTSGHWSYATVLSVYARSCSQHQSLRSTSTRLMLHWKALDYINASR